MRRVSSEVGWIGKGHDEVDVAQVFQAPRDGSVRLDRGLESHETPTDVPLL